jgi:hypothetical protein
MLIARSGLALKQEQRIMSAQEYSFKARLCGEGDVTTNIILCDKDFA